MGRDSKSVFGAFSAFRSPGGPLSGVSLLNLEESMTQLQSPQGRRVLIIEDEFLIALDLEATMFKIGFDVCALAPSASKARSLAMNDQPNDQPDVALVDVCLEGGREGIEIARGLRAVA